MTEINGKLFINVFEYISGSGTAVLYTELTMQTVAPSQPESIAVSAFIKGLTSMHLHFTVTFRVSITYHIFLCITP